MEEITGVEPEDNEHDEDLVFSDDDDNLSTIPEEDEEPYVQPDNHNITRCSGRLSPRSVVSNIEPAIPLSYLDPELTALADTSERRYPSRNRKAVKRLDPFHNSKRSYDNTMIQYMCMVKMAEKQEQKRLSLHKGLKV